MSKHQTFPFILKIGQIMVLGHLIICFEKYSIELFGHSVCEHARIFLQETGGSGVIKQ